jgi:hypothetical protein
MPSKPRGVGYNITCLPGKPRSPFVETRVFRVPFRPVIHADHRSGRAMGRSFLTKRRTLNGNDGSHFRERRRLATGR